MTGVQSNACWFFFVPTFPMTNNFKKEVAPQNETGRDEKQFFYLAVGIRSKYLSDALDF